MAQIKDFVAQNSAIGNLLLTSIRQEVLKALNVKPPKPSFYISFLERIAPSDANAARSYLEDWVSKNTAQGSLFERNYLALAPEVKLPSTPESGWSWPQTVPRDQGRIVLAALVSSRLRTLVDEWLETGRNREFESPGVRNIEMTYLAYSAVDNFVRQYPPQFVPGGYSSFVYARGGHFKAGNVFESRDVEATRLFVNLIISDWNKRLCKCRYCGEYFHFEKPRTDYPHGTFCKPEHQRNMSAYALTTSLRSQAKSNLIKLAAHWLAALGPRSAGWKSDRTLKDQLAKHLSGQMSRKPNLCSGRDQVTGSWVTWNRNQIGRELLIQQRSK
jgi:hypothetical protein